MTRDEQVDDGFSEVGTETCKICGAVYHITMNRGEVRVHDWFNCAVCGRMLMEWDSNETPSFTLLGARYQRKPR